MQSTGKQKPQVFGFHTKDNEMLIPLSEVKDFLGIDALNSEYDSFLTLYGDMYSDAMEVYCRRKFLSATYTQTFYKDHFEGRNTDLYLYHFPLISVTSIFEGDLEIENFRVAKNIGMVTNKDGWFISGEEIVAIYEAGYTTLPNPLKYSLLSLLQSSFNRKKEGIDVNFGSDVQSIAIPGVLNISFDYSLQNNDQKSVLGVMLREHLNVLDQYKSERKFTGVTVRESYVD